MPTSPTSSRPRSCPRFRVLASIATALASACCTQHERTPDAATPPAHQADDPHGLAQQFAAMDLINLSRSWTPAGSPQAPGDADRVLIPVPDDRALVTSDYPRFFLAIEQANDRAWLLRTGSIDGHTVWFGPFTYSVSASEIVQQLSAATR
ncbi:MAG: hypothetical protein KF768_00595 [Phycisphaeraceae bacterium]|nr:hypothetical protein [Phycisphaeraceae bacterium]